MRRHAACRAWRFCRSDAARWLALVVLAPLLVLSPFGGRTIVAHGHEGDGVHIHAIDGHSAVAVASAVHQAVEDCQRRRAGDADGHDHGGRSPTPQDGESGGVSVPDHEPLRAREMGLIAAGASWPAMLGWSLPVPAGLEDAASRPPRATGRLRGDGCRERAGDRLVRTSLALLL